MLCHYYQRTGYPTPQQVKHSLVNCEKFRRLLGPNQLPLPAEITVVLTKPGAVRPAWTIPAHCPVCVKRLPLNPEYA